MRQEDLNFGELYILSDGTVVMYCTAEDGVCFIDIEDGYHITDAKVVVLGDFDGTISRDCGKLKVVPLEVNLK